MKQINRTDVKSLVQNYIEMNKELRIEYDELKIRISQIDKEQSDILHSIELKSFNASLGYVYAKQLKDIRNKRREVKDKMDLLRSILEITPQVDALNKKLEISKRPKRYTPRIRTDLTFEFDKIYAKTNPIS